MKATELKSEIQKVLDNVPEDILEDVLLYLQEVQKSTSSKFSNYNHLKKILSEDKELLKKLAQ